MLASYEAGRPALILLFFEKTRRAKNKNTHARSAQKGGREGEGKGRKRKGERREKNEKRRESGGLCPKKVRPEVIIPMHYRLRYLMFIET